MAIVYFSFWVILFLAVALSVPVVGYLENKQRLASLPPADPIEDDEDPNGEFANDGAESFEEAQADEGFGADEQFDGGGFGGDPFAEEIKS